MLFKLFLLFTIIPILEIIILIKLSGIFGVFETLIIVIGTGMWGAYLARREGLRVWNNLQYELRQGKIPADNVIDGLLVFAAGIVLITPGLITDISGFLILFPANRNWIRNQIKRTIQAKIKRRL